MIVVSDTTPLNYLILIEVIDILPALYGRVMIPEAVLVELTASGAPGAVRAWALRLPEWVSLYPVDVVDPSLRLHAGEAETIALALQQQVDLVLLDDRAARVAAVSRGLAITGTLGILAVAAERGLVDLPTVVERLRHTSFQARPDLYDALLERAAHARQ